jgi:hypothetical protein
MFCPVSLRRRWPVLFFVYAFALQAIAVNWNGAAHGLRVADGVDSICRSMVAIASDAAPGTVPLSPAGHHDCALACLNALGGGAFSLAKTAAPSVRSAFHIVALADEGAAFQELRIASAAFAARAPPRLI